MATLPFKIALVMSMATALSVLLFVTLTWLKIENTLSETVKARGQTAALELRREIEAAPGDAASLIAQTLGHNPAVLSAAMIDLPGSVHGLTVAVAGKAFLIDAPLAGEAGHGLRMLYSREPVGREGRRLLRAMLGIALPWLALFLIPAWLGCRLILRPLLQILAGAEAVLDGSAAPAAVPPGLAEELDAFGRRLRQAAETEGLPT